MCAYILLYKPGYYIYKPVVDIMSQYMHRINKEIPVILYLYTYTKSSDLLI